MASGIVWIRLRGFSQFSGLVETCLESWWKKRKRCELTQKKISSEKRVLVSIAYKKSESKRVYVSQSVIFSGFVYPSVTHPVADAGRATR